MKRSILFSAALFFSILGIAAQPVLAVKPSEAGFILGTGRHADMAALVVAAEAPWSWRDSEQGRIHTYWQAYLSQWKGKGDGGQTLHGIGLAPVFRYSWKNSDAWQPYVEGAIGVHFFSGIRLSTAKRMGTRFEFGDHIGFGLRIGKVSGLDVGYRFQHYSNASASVYNAGVDFHQAHLRFFF